MAIFNSKLLNYQRVWIIFRTGNQYVALPNTQMVHHFPQHTVE